MLRMQEFLNGWKPPTELTNPISIWEWLKFEIKKVSSSYTRDIYLAEKKHISDLNQELQALYQGMDEEESDLSLEIESVRRELREIEENKARKIIFRAKSNWSTQIRRGSCPEESLAIVSGLWRTRWSAYKRNTRREWWSLSIFQKHSIPSDGA